MNLPGPCFKNKENRAAAWLWVTAVSLLAALPLLLSGPTEGHDFRFHVGSWMATLEFWHSGHFYPHWVRFVHFGAGEPRLLFYPPLSWMLGAALGAILPWKLVPFALAWIFLFLAGFCTRRLAGEFLSDQVAVLAGCSSVFSIYLLYCIYERCAWAELTGGFWIPLLLLYLLRDCPTESSVWRRALDGSALPLALVVCGIWISNLPLGIMAFYLLPGASLLLAILRRSLAPLLRAGLALTAGLTAAAFVIVPVLAEKPWVQADSAVRMPWTQVEHRFLFAHEPVPQLVVGGIAYPDILFLEVFTLLVAVACILTILRRQKEIFRRPEWILMAALPIAVFCMAWSFSLPIWNLLPNLRYLQFPWRWMILVPAPLGLLLAFAAGSRQQVLQRARLVGLFCAGLFVLALVVLVSPGKQVASPEKSIAVVRDGYLSPSPTYEYLSPGVSEEVAQGLPAVCLSQNPQVPLGAERYSFQQAKVRVWTPEQKSCDPVAESWSGSPEQLRLSTQLPKSGWLILRLNRYPAWRVSLNGQEQKNLPQRADGLIVVPAQAGQADLAVDWQTTPDVWLGRGLSLLGVLALTALWALERRPRRAHLS